MSLSITRDVDTAIVQRLAGDATLAALLPGGVFWDVATLGATQYVVVSQMSHDTEYVLPNVVLWERVLYQVKVVVKGSSGIPLVEDAYTRIFQLLQNQEAALSTPSYTLRAFRFVERVRATEVEEQTDQKWQHEGAHYECLAVPLVLA